MNFIYYILKIIKNTMGCKQSRNPPSYKEFNDDYKETEKKKLQEILLSEEPNLERWRRIIECNHLSHDDIRKTTDYLSVKNIGQSKEYRASSKMLDEFAISYIYTLSIENIEKSIEEKE